MWQVRWAMPPRQGALDTHQPLNRLPTPHTLPTPLQALASAARTGAVGELNALTTTAGMQAAWALNAFVGAAAPALPPPLPPGGFQADRPLAGVPFAIKANLCAAGMPATAGSAALAGTPHGCTWRYLRRCGRDCVRMYACASFPPFRLSRTLQGTLHRILPPRWRVCRRQAGTSSASPIWMSLGWGLPLRSPHMGRAATRGAAVI